MTECKKEIKCVVWDLDNTIWDGVLIEGDSLKLKPGIKEIIQTLDNRGILQSIASKNNYDDAMEKLKEFELDKYFLYPNINWNPKSISLESIQRNLWVEMDAVLFIDDQAFERNEVKNAHPEITCIDASEYLRLPDMKRLNPEFITDESKNLRKMHLDDIKRKEAEEIFDGPSEDFLASLQMEFIIHEAFEKDLKRCEELIVRNKQMNTTNRTYSYSELNSFMLSDKHLLLVCELTDKHGSYGKTGLSLIEMRGDYNHLRLLVLSCRVLSRGVGTVLLSHIMRETKNAGKKLLVDFKRTGINRQMYISFKFANFKEVSCDDDGNCLLENDLSTIPPFPPYVNVKVEKQGEY